MSLARISVHTSLRSFFRTAGCAGRSNLLVFHRNAATATSSGRRLQSRRTAPAVGMARINHFLRTVERYLESDEDEDQAYRAFFFKLAESGVQAENRAIAYEKGVLLFFEHERYEDAFRIYQKMNGEGLLPSVALRARMLVLNAIMQDSKRSEITDGFKKLFAEVDVDERTLREVLMFMENETDADHVFVREIARLYSASKGKGFKFDTAMSSYLVYINLCIGSTKDANAVLEDYAAKSAEEDKTPEPDPYTTYIDKLLDKEDYSGEDVDAILARMESDGVEPDSHVFNLLIVHEVRNSRYEKAFELYRYLLANQSPTIKPDSFTFGSLFNALYILNAPRTAFTRRTKAPRNAVSPRGLFNEMLQAHLAATSYKSTHTSNVLSPGVLNLALFTFLTRADYAGAFVAARAFRACGLRPDAMTLREAFGILKRKVFRVVRAPPRHPYRRWMNRFVGYPLGPSMSAATTENEIMASLIGIGREPQLSLYSTDYRSSDLEQELENTIERMFGLQEETLGAESEGNRFTIEETEKYDGFETFFEEEALMEPEVDETQQSAKSQHPPLLASLGEDVPPLVALQNHDTNRITVTTLERVLRRALLASLPDGTELEPWKSVSAAIVEAKRQMIPVPKRQARERDNASEL